MNIFNNDHFLLLWVGIMAVVLTFAGSSVKVKMTVLGEETERYNLIFAILIFAPIFLLASVWEIRSDVWQYLVNFSSFNKSILDVFSSWNQSNSEPGFDLIQAVIKSIFGDNREAFRYIIGLLQSIPIIIILRKYSEHYLLSIFLFITLGYYDSWMMNGIRQFIAVCIIFLATPLLLKRKYIPLIFVILLACTVHQSAIIMIPIVFIVFMNPWKPRTWLVIGLLVIAICIYYNNFAVVSEEIKNSDDGANFLRIFFALIPVVLAYIKKDDLKQINNSLINVCIVFSMINVGIIIAAVFTSGILVGRLPIYVSIYNLILIPYLLYKVYNIVEKKTYFWGIFAIYIAYFEVSFITYL